MIFKCIIVSWGCFKASWIFIRCGFNCRLFIWVIEIVVNKSCSQLQIVVMLLLSESHLRAFRVGGLLPWIRPTISLLLAKCPWLLFIVIDMLLCCGSDLIVVVVFIASDNPSLSLAVLPEASSHGLFLRGLLRCLPDAVRDPVEVCAVFFPLIVSLVIDEDASLCLDEGGLL